MTLHATRWPSSSAFEVPSLDPTLQADGLVRPLEAWGRKRGRHQVGTWHFYEDDHRFDHLYRRPDRLVATGPTDIVEPNFSAWDQCTFPEALWAIYRKRWLARYWQGVGIGVWVDLNVGEPWQALNLEGVPRGWRAYATRGYSDRPDDLVSEFETAARHCGAMPQVLVYGGGFTVAELCRELGALYVEPDTIERTKASRLLARAARRSDPHIGQGSSVLVGADGEEAV